MISPDYFSFRWSWYRPILNRQEQPADRCTVEVRRLPIRVTGEDAGEYIPYAVQPEIERQITTSLRHLQDYAIRYVVRGEKISGHKLPNMDAKVRQMVAYLRQQNPHLPRDLLHHWCAEQHGATALLTICETLWEQGWKQDKSDAAPWVPAVNVLLLKLIRQAIARLSDEYTQQTTHAMLCVIGGLYVWALQRFLKRYLEGVVEVRRIATYESMMLPATPMAFLQYQPDVSLLGDDSRVIRAYGLEPEIVPRMRLLRAKVGMHNEGGMLQLLAKDKLGAHLQRRCWLRLSLWKLAMQSGFGGWMRYVLDAKQLDQLLAGKIQPDDAAMQNLHRHPDTPVAQWLLAHMQGAAKTMGEPWLQDNITLMAFRVFEEDVKVEVARRHAEKLWLDRKDILTDSGKAGSTRQPATGLRRAGGLHIGAAGAPDIALDKAWRDGEIVLIQSDASKALHSGRTLSQRQGCLRIEWSEYLALMHALHGTGASAYLSQTFLPGLLPLLNDKDDVFLDSCSASGCLLRGSLLALTEIGIAVRQQLRQCFAITTQQQQATGDIGMPALSMCMDMTGEWSFAECQIGKTGQAEKTDKQRIAFSLAVPQVDAGVRRDSSVEKIMRTRDAAQGLQSIGAVNVLALKSQDTDSTAHILHNCGFALTAAAMTELTSALANKASMRSLRLGSTELKGVLDTYRLPAGGLELLIIQRYGEEAQPPWLLIKAGMSNLAGIDMDIFELLDVDTLAAQHIIERGLIRWL